MWTVEIHCASKIVQKGSSRLRKQSERVSNQPDYEQKTGKERTPTLVKNDSRPP